VRVVGEELEPRRQLGLGRASLHALALVARLVPAALHALEVDGQARYRGAAAVHGKVERAPASLARAEGAHVLEEGDLVLRRVCRLAHGDHRAVGALVAVLVQVLDAFDGDAHLDVQVALVLEQ
jgi:hypothetical protein